MVKTEKRRTWMNKFSEFADGCAWFFHLYYHCAILIFSNGWMRQPDGPVQYDNHISSTSRRRPCQMWLRRHLPNHIVATSERRPMRDNKTDSTRESTAVSRPTMQNVATLGHLRATSPMPDSQQKSTLRKFNERPSRWVQPPSCVSGLPRTRFSLSRRAALATTPSTTALRRITLPLVVMALRDVTSAT